MSEPWRRRRGVLLTESRDEDDGKAFRDMGPMTEMDVLSFLRIRRRIRAGDNAFTNKGARDALAAIANRK